MLNECKNTNFLITLLLSVCDGHTQYDKLCMYAYNSMHTESILANTLYKNFLHKYKLFTALLFISFVCGVHNYMSE